MRFQWSAYAVGIGSGLAVGTFLAVLNGWSPGIHWIAPAILAIALVVAGLVATYLSGGRK